MKYSAFFAVGEDANSSREFLFFYLSQIFIYHFSEEKFPFFIVGEDANNSLDFIVGKDANNSRELEKIASAL